MAESANNSFLLRIHNADQVVRVCANREPFKISKQMDEVEVIEKATVIVDKRGLIAYVGRTADLPSEFANATFECDIDAAGKSVVPGFIDAHTHPVWSGDRVHEFAMKLAGATYMDIHKMGGGIGFTVNHTRNSTADELQKLLLQRLDRMLKFGTTMIEAKSGYGLETATEMKMLKVLHDTNKIHPIEIVSTYLGAHSVPKGMTVDEYTNDIINNQIPELIKLRDKGEISVENIDVFYEKGVFEEDNTNKILKCGKSAGLNINFHGDELNPMKSGKIANELNANAVSHLEKVDDDDIKMMSIKPTVAVLLPTTAYILRISYPPARRFIDLDVPVALGTDFNPNAHCLSMPHVMNLACVNMKMTMNESLVASTINSAASIGKSDLYGSIEIGKYGDLVLIDSPKWEHIIYELIDPPIHSVFKKGKIVSSK